jgi:hypothetical protein
LLSSKLLFYASILLARRWSSSCLRTMSTYKCSQRVGFSFVRLLAAPFYSAFGRPSLDPVVFVKLLIVQHLENTTSRQPSTLSDS